MAGLQSHGSPGVSTHDDSRPTLHTQPSIPRGSVETLTDPLALSQTLLTHEASTFLNLGGLSTLPRPTAVPTFLTSDEFRHAGSAPSGVVTQLDRGSQSCHRQQYHLTSEGNPACPSQFSSHSSANRPQGRGLSQQPHHPSGIPTARASPSASGFIAIRGRCFLGSQAEETP